MLKYLGNPTATPGGAMHPDDKRPNFNNLVFWDAVRHHPTANLDFLLADKMGLDTGQMLETQQLRIELYAQMMGIDIGQAEAEIADAAAVYRSAYLTARREWEKLLAVHSGDFTLAAQQALDTGWLALFSNNGGMSASQAVAHLAWSIN